MLMIMVMIIIIIMMMAMVMMIHIETNDYDGDQGLVDISYDDETSFLDPARPLRKAQYLLTVVLTIIC